MLNEKTVDHLKLIPRGIFFLGPLVAESYTESLESWRQKFDERFEDTFELEKKGNQISFGRNFSLP